MSDQKTKHTTTFDDALDDDDFGLIVSSKGELKGIWMPEGKDEEEVPEGITDMLMRYWGVDPNSPEQTATLH
tara:strand:- start:246 stop:461 length:216 start_codon:yes stop_codon:yes gene_type:complete